MPTTSQLDALRGATDGFRSYLETSTDFQPVTKRTYAREARNFLRDVGVRSIGALTPAILQTWHAAMVERGLSSSTIQQRHAAVRQFLMWLDRFQGNARARPLLPALLFLRAPREQGVKRKPDPLDPALVLRVMTVADEAGAFYGPRLRALLHLLYATGMRASEVANLKLETLSLEERTATVWAKGGEERVVVFTEACRTDLEAWCRERERYRALADTLFVSARGRTLTGTDVWALVRKACRQAGIERRVWTHLFRHTRITSLLQGGMPIQDVAAYVGHRSINTTMGYYNPSTARIKTLYDEYGDQDGGQPHHRGKRSGETAVEARNETPPLSPSRELG